MKRLSQLFLTVFLGLCFSLFIQPVYAADCSLVSPQIIYAKDSSAIVIFSYSYFTNISDIGKITMCTGGITPKKTFQGNEIKSEGGKNFSVQLSGDLMNGCNTDIYHPAGPASFSIYNSSGNLVCDNLSIPVDMNYSSDVKACYISTNPTPTVAGQSFTVIVENKPTDYATGIKLVARNNLGMGLQEWSLSSDSSITMSGMDKDTELTYYVEGVVNGVSFTKDNPICSLNVIIGGRNTPGQSAPLPGGGGSTALGITNICSFSGEPAKCTQCFSNSGVYTPFGCIQTNPQAFVEQLLKIAIGLGGGIAFLMIIYGGFVTMTSAGNPEKLNGGKEIVTSAIVGLLLIVFSVVILKIIGVDIFKIPGLA